VSDFAVSVEDVSKRFRLYHDRGTSLKERLVKRGQARYEDLWALDDISFRVEEGETIGILGHNGSGKSTLLKCVCGVLQPTAGQVVVRGKLAGLLELGAGFQPELSGRDNIYLNASMLGLSKSETDDVFDEIVAFSELEQFIDNQVKFYSSGMYVRLGFAVAVSVEPDILVIDEVLAVGDERFQRKCLDRIRQFQEQGRTIIVVTHSADQIKSICDRAVVLSHGKMVAMGAPGHAVQIFREGLLTEGVAEVPPPEIETEVEVEDHHRPVRLRGVTVSHPGSAESLPLKSGDPLEVNVGFTASEPVDAVVFELEVHSTNGTLLIKTTTDDLGINFNLEQGEGSMTFSFPSWPFGDEELKLSVGVKNRLGGVVFDWLENAGTVEAVYEGRAAGVLNLPMEASLVTGGTIHHIAD